MTVEALAMEIDRRVVEAGKGKLSSPDRTQIRSLVNVAVVAIAKKNGLTSVEEITLESLPTVAITFKQDGGYSLAIQEPS